MAEHYSYRPQHINRGQNVVVTLKLTLDSYPTDRDLDNLVGLITDYTRKQLIQIIKPIETKVQLEEASQ